MANKEKTLEELKVEAELAQKAYETAKKLEEQKQKEEAMRKRAELEAVKEKRKAEIAEAEKHYKTLIKNYIKDYGSYQVVNSYDEDDDFPSLFGIKPFNWFL
jgi:capsule polysaccharide export protein KpsE/RkpR